MAKPRRDDFSSKTKRRLAERVGFMCSFPNCNLSTIGPSLETVDGAAIIGEACHIAAAASGPGAPRYDPTMTPEQRRSIDNGIWMCRNHAKLIDTDEKTYTVEKLRQWKQEAEERARHTMTSTQVGSLIRILHLSDFHVGGDDYGQRVLFERVLGHIQHRVQQNASPDLVLITGDIALTGEASQYEQFKNGFLIPLQEILPKVWLYIVPGNHDVNRNMVRVAHDNGLLTTSPEFFAPNKAGLSYRKQLFPCFQAFVDSLAMFTPTSWVLGESGTHSKIITMGDAKVGILLLNTAWLSYGGDDSIRLNITKEMVLHGLDQLKAADIVLVLGHHPLESLDKASANDLMLLFDEEKVFYLSGHRHSTKDSYRRSPGGNSHFFSAGVGFLPRNRDGWVNGFQWYELDLPGRRAYIEPLTWNPESDEWRLATDQFPNSRRVPGKDRWFFEINRIHPATDRLSSATTNKHEVPPIDHGMAAGVTGDHVNGIDLLGVEAEVNALTQTICMAEVEPPLVVGILGGWGTGKSFVMHLIQKEMGRLRSLPAQLALEQKNPVAADKLVAYVGHLYPIHFNAWTYAKSNLWASLMQEIFCQLEEQVSLEKRLEKVGLKSLEGGPAWAALMAMSRGERNLILANAHYFSIKQLEELKQLETTQQCANHLWSSLVDLRKTRQKELCQAQHELASQQKLDMALAVALNHEKQVEEAELQQELARLEKPHLLYKHLARELGPKADVLASSFRAMLGKSLEETLDIDPKQLKKQWTEFEALGQTTWPNLKLLCRLLWDQPRVTLILLTLTSVIYIFGQPFDEWFNNKLGALVGLVVTALAPLLRYWKGLSGFRKHWQEQIKNFDLEAERSIAEKALIARFSGKDPKNLPESMTRQRELVARREEVARQIGDIQTRISHHRRQVGLTFGHHSLSDFLNSRLKEANYASKLGLMHQVQTDLTELSNCLLLEETRGKLFPRGSARLVLFIDDVDRCPPRKVVQILEATQLLIKSKLFVVVIALDLRYVTKALEKEYKDILHCDTEPSGLDYIEKIIQIPYRVHPPNDLGMYSLLAGKRVLEVPNHKNEQDNGTEQSIIQEPEDKSMVSMSSGQNGRTKKTRILNDTLSWTEMNESENEFTKIVPRERRHQSEVSLSDEELNCLNNFCVRMAVTPRTAKRVKNVTKLIKVVCHESQPKLPKLTGDAAKAMSALLVLAASQPKPMRAFYENLKSSFEDPDETKHNPVLASLFPEKIRFLAEELLPKKIRSDEVTKPILKLVRSFSFIEEPSADAEPAEKP